jgi:hypothetical protein
MAISFSLKSMAALNEPHKSSFHGSMIDITLPNYPGLSQGATLFSPNKSIKLKIFDDVFNVCLKNFQDPALSQSLHPFLNNNYVFVQFTFRDCPTMLIATHGHIVWIVMNVQPSRDF